MNGTSTADLPRSSIPIFTTVASFREWRRQAFRESQSVGFVPTMGALHEGHLSLVRKSLAENDLTVLSIFVNPAQFAPHEDLATYPRTLPRDLELLESQTFAVADPSQVGNSMSRQVSAVFLPSVQEMYPSGISQNIDTQKGTFIEVKGFSHQMEGQSRPTFFRGVATVVSKLFNAVEPTKSYFGQKDIQQALLLRRLCRDLLLAHPDPANLCIVPTARDPATGLALSSRNAYLTEDGRKAAPTLYQALQAANLNWDAGATKAECIEKALSVIEASQARVKTEGLAVNMRLDYLEMNSTEDFEIMDGVGRRDAQNPVPVILSGALWVDKTRLIDNIILDDANRIISS